MITIDKELLKRLPRTFAPALNEQLGKWDLLFPVEQRTLKGQLDYLAGLSASDFDGLFRPVKDVEAKMQLPAWEASSGRISIADTSLLVRSPYYPQWRAEVEKVFAQIEAADRHEPRRSVLVCLLPAGCPPPKLALAGRTLTLPAAFSAGAAQFWQALARGAGSAADPAERTWVFEAGDGVSRSLASGTEGLTLLSFEGLAPARKEFLQRLNNIKKDLRSADQAFDQLRRLDLAALLGKGLARDARLSSFIRDLFLSGNGALLFGNSFVEWGASEALRRAQPQLMICSFGIRRKLKPFSSLAVFEDQGRANPTPEQDDAPSSFLDAQILAEYVSLTTSRLPSYAGQTLALFAAEDSNLVRLLAPPSFSPAPFEIGAAIASWMVNKI